MRYAALHAAEFALQAVLRSEALPVAGPAALLSDRARGATLLEANAPAREAGIEPGLTAPQALARCAQLALRVRSPSAEAEAQAALAAAAAALSPRAERTAPGLITVDLAGHPPPARLALVRAAVDRLRFLGIEATAGIARTPLIALYAARLARPVLEVHDEPAFLSPLPLSAAEPEPGLAEILESWGIRTLGALAALPQAQVGLRLGAAGARLWERAAGRADRPIDPMPAERDFSAALEWEEPIEILEPLLFILRRFVERLALGLSGAGLSAGELRLELALEDETTHRRSLGLPDPTADPEILFRALHTHLESLRTASAVCGARLSAEPVRPPVRQQDLFESGLKDPHGFSETLARIEALLGAGSVGTPRLEPGHRPDSFALDRPALSVVGMPPRPARGPLGPPLRRFRPPLPAEVACDGATPAFLRCAAAQGRVRSARGPWISSGQWWSAGAWAREEWDAELEPGGVFRLLRSGAVWRVDGVYD